ncbi:hypothetical protein MP638_004027 [Amoeboaphelidium occidentale]|nr:hypothetical protein MP638_004027 [Amoeboaphelidium occidentale]
MGRIFVEFENEVYDKDENLSVNELHGRMSELKEVHPELSQNRYWHSFEDFVFSKNPDFWGEIDLKSTDNNGVEYWMENLEFAKKNGYKNLSKLVIKQEDVEAYLDFLKECLKWRLHIDDLYWRNVNIELRCKIVCIVDETVRDIFFPKGFNVDEEVFYEIEDKLFNGCSLNFRRACRKILCSSEYVNETDELVKATRKACQKR